MKYSAFLLYLLSCLTVILFSTSILAQDTTTHHYPSPGMAALAEIRPIEIAAQISAMADAHWRGREAGTVDELKVAVWMANVAKEIGLKPAGDDGTYFQFFSMWRNRIAASSNISIGDRSLALWTDVLVPQTASATIDAPLLYIERGDTATANVKGKAVVLLASPDGVNLNVSLPLRRYPTLLARKYAAGLLSRGAAAVIFVADSLAEAAWQLNASYFDHGTYDIEGGPNEKVSARPPVIWVHHSQLDPIKKPGLVFRAQLNIEHFEYPSVNVVGKFDGTDRMLSNEYVLYSGHIDHDGIRNTGPGADSIYYGADDNASVSAAMFAIARAFAKQHGRRPVLFVWHGAEERGLLGSRWYATHPTVPKSSIIAVLNGDMIGRNSPDSAALLGVQPPHRNSSQLVSIALAANEQGPRFKLDTLYDKSSHIEGWYFRSDHLPYARAGIPAVFFTSLLHPDYHTPRDKADRIDAKKVARIAEWMYRTGWQLSNNIDRPAVDANFKLER